MKMTCTAHPEAHYLFFLVTENYHYDEAVQLFKSVREQCDRTSFQKAIIDIRQMLKEIPQWDRFKLGEQAAIIWGSQIQVAIVTQPDQVNRFFETVAVNRNTQVRVFGDMKAVYPWLQIEQP